MLTIGKVIKKEKKEKYDFPYIELISKDRVKKVKFWNDAEKLIGLSEKTDKVSPALDVDGNVYIVNSDSNIATLFNTTDCSTNNRHIYEHLVKEETDKSVYFKVVLIDEETESGSIKALKVEPIENTIEVPTIQVVENIDTEDIDIQ